MIPRDFIVEWAAIVPWQQIEQIEQDLIITTALLKIYQHSQLREKVAFRGGTALNKLYFNPPTRYSEDIDLVQIVGEPIGPTITMIRQVMDSWLGSPKRERSEGRVTLIYRTTSDNGFPIKLKIEINTCEHFTVMGFKEQLFSSSSGWHSGQASIKTYALEELLGTKLRALFQRRKGRDLYDLYIALKRYPNLNINAIIQCFIEYTTRSNHPISREDFHLNMREKLNRREFREDIIALLAQQEKQFSAEAAYELIAREIIDKLSFHK